MHIMMVASEAVPFAKVGGLADVTSSLSKELGKHGHKITMFLPYYRTIKNEALEGKIRERPLIVNMSDKMIQGEIISKAMAENVTALFVKNDGYYDRDGIYGTEKGGYGDNAERFIFFCKAAIEAIKGMRHKPDIVHCHDWHTGLIPVYLKTVSENKPCLTHLKTVFTIHNLAYQGIFLKEILPLAGIPLNVFTPQGIEFYGKISFLKGGIVYADKITTVSKRYVSEIQTKEYGCGMDETLISRKKDLFGILNGSDYEDWNPEKDKFIVKNYSTSNLSGKRDCKEYILKEFGIHGENGIPLFGLVSRLTSQKGIDLVIKTADKILELGDLVILGMGEDVYQKQLVDLKNRYPDKVGLKIGFDDALAHRIIAACDFFLMPSQYEPCGLSVMYSLRYGTIPIARATGGLDDTISQFNPTTGEGNGFKFSEYSGEHLLSCLKAATQTYNTKKLLNKLQKNALRCNFSWEKPSCEYEKLYLKTLGQETKPNEC